MRLWNLRHFSLTERFISRVPLFLSSSSGSLPWKRFRWPYPTDDFGHCWPFVDRYVLQYPQLFRSPDEFDNEGFAIRLDEEAKFNIPGCCDGPEQKIRRVLEFVFARIVVDGHGDVVQIHEGRREPRNRF